MVARPIIRRPVSYCLLGISMLTPAVALTAEITDAVEEVVVTATKRQTTLQDTEISITVLDAQAIDDARLRDVRRLKDLVPNVHFNESGQLSNVFITIRGVESNPFIVNRASVYIDGIPFRELTNAVLNQVESIEVLRGPQGTLYGANSESGLILLRTRAPTSDVHGEVRATGSLYSDTGAWESDGYVSGGVAEDVAGSLSFKVSDESAYQRNRAVGVGDPGSITERFAHARLRWTPNERLTINGAAYVLDINAPGLFDNDFFPMNRAAYDATYGAAFNSGRTSGRYRYFHDAPSRTDETEYVAGASATYALNKGNIDVAASYRRDRSDSRGLDFDFTALPTAAGRDNDDVAVTQAEVRYTSTGDKPLQYIVGASVYDEANENFKATFVGPGTLDSYVSAPVQEKESRDYSLFSTISYRLPFAPKFTLSGGLRYDDARQSTRQHAGALDLGLAGVIYYRDVALEDDSEAWLPRVSLKYEVSDGLTLYSSAAKGYIPGGFNLAAAQEGIVDTQVLRYDAETLWSYEAGFKTRSSDRKWSASGAVFYIRSDNWQEIRVLADEQGRPVTSDFVGSDASIDSAGFEFETSYAVTQALHLIGNVGYADARYRRLSDGIAALDGNRVKLVPEYDAMIAARYELPGGLFSRLEVGFTGETELDERNRATQPAVTTINLQIGFEGDRYSMRVFGENLTDERRFSGLAFENLGFGTDGNYYGPLDAPRIVGIELEAKW